MTTINDGEGLRRVTGWLLAIAWSVTIITLAAVPSHTGADPA
jgi:preprotein translocase subunit SecG